MDSAGGAEAPKAPPPPKSATANIYLAGIRV